MEPSLDSASVSVTNPQTHEVECIDVPMRAFTEGYYHNLKAMYDHLGVRYRVQPFLFSFSRIAAQKAFRYSTSGEIQYFIHASNNHRLPPIKPGAMRLPSYLLELTFAFVCYLWFSLSCLYIQAQPEDERHACESFGEYLQRIRLPQYFVKFYLLPLMSAVTTCPHRSLLAFPAKDIVDYKRSITSGRQLTVTEGVNDVQNKLLKGVYVRFSARVVSVKLVSSRLKVCWQACRKEEEVVTEEKVFDKVILAVPPNIVGAVFEPLRKEMDLIPTMPVESVVHVDEDAIASMSHCMEESRKIPMLLDGKFAPAHVIHLRTSSGTDPCTEATHVQVPGTMVTTCPLTQIDPSKIIRSSTFTRVLRTPDSREQLKEMFDYSWQSSLSEKSPGWRNGDDRMWLVGGWDGMVLLEGCVVSAMRVARALGVEIPW